MVFKLIVSIILILASYGAGFYFSGGENIALFIDIPTIICVCFVTFLILFASWPLKDMGRAFSAPYSMGATKVELLKSKEFFTSMRKALVWSALVSSLIGFISILRYMSYEPFDAERLGLNFAVAILSVFQAGITVLVLALPFESAARRRLAELES